MNDLTCSEIADLLPAFVLDAVDDEEHRALMEHLAECRRHDSELQAARLTALGLIETITPVAPPPGLRGSLLEAFDKEVARAIVSRPAQQAPIQSAGHRKPKLQLFRTPTFAYGLAAGFLLLALALGAWGASRSPGGDDVSSVRLATARANGMRLDVTYLPSQQVAVLNFDMPPPPSGRAYQAWQIRDGKAVSLGLISTNSGSTAFKVDLAGASAVAISIEPAGGSTVPTSDPVVISTF